MIFLIPCGVASVAVFFGASLILWWVWLRLGGLPLSLGMGQFFGDISPSPSMVNLGQEEC